MFPFPNLQQPRPVIGGAGSSRDCLLQRKPLVTVTMHASAGRDENDVAGAEAARRLQLQWRVLDSKPADAAAAAAAAADAAVLRHYYSLLPQDRPAWLPIAFPAGKYRRPQTLFLLSALVLALVYLGYYGE